MVEYQTLWKANQRQMQSDSGKILEIGVKLQKVTKSYDLRSFNHYFYNSITNPQGESEQKFLGDLREKDNNTLIRLKQDPKSLDRLSYLFNDRYLS